MNRERLERLATLLDNYREDGGTRFDLGTWGETTTRRGGFLYLQKLTCNTAACAVGIACFSGAFVNDGLRYVLDSEGSIRPILRRHDGLHDGWNAVEQFFDLTELQARRLFSETQYSISYGEAGAKAVARRIRAMTKPRTRKPKTPKTNIAVFNKMLTPPDKVTA